MPKISVLMPVYNAERYLREAIDSILNQSFQDFEFLILDDGSTDSSIQIIKAYPDNRIRLVENAHNLGITPTLNKGIELASASLIARMDADDISLPNRLETLYAQADKYPNVALFASWVSIIDESGKIKHTEEFPPEHYYFNQLLTCWIYHPSMLFRKNALVRLGAYTEPFAEDFDIIFRLMLKWQFLVIPEVLLYYRITSQSLHQVLKKSEYDLAQKNQVIRNIAFYAPQLAILEDWEIKALQGNVMDLIQQPSPLKCLIKITRYLEKLGRAVAQKPNPNNIYKQTLAAATIRKNYIVTVGLAQLSVRTLVKGLFTKKISAYIINELKSRIKLLLK